MKHYLCKDETDPEFYEVLRELTEEQKRRLGVLYSEPTNYVLVECDDKRVHAVYHSKLPSTAVELSDEEAFLYSL